MEENQVRPSRYTDIDGVEIDPAKVPMRFRHLIALAGIWSIGDDVERIDFMGLTSNEDLECLIAAVEPLDDEIWQWCSSHHQDVPVPDEVLVFDYLLQATAEARQMLKSKRT